MDIFESLENLEVSEACFDEIIGIVEDLVSKVVDKNKEAGNLAVLKGLRKVSTAKGKELESSAKNKGISVDDLVKERTSNKNIEGVLKTDKRRFQVHDKKYKDPQTDILEYPKAKEKVEKALSAYRKHNEENKKSEGMRDNPSSIWYEGIRKHLGDK